MHPQWLIYLNDGRVGLGLYKYRKQNKTYYVVSGFGFYLDNIRPDSITKRIPI